MTVENYNKIMVLLDLMEDELNKIAVELGHENFKEWSKKDK